MFLSLFLPVILISLISANCPEGWVPFGEKCYFLETEKTGMNFFEAFLLCHNILGAQLLTVSSIEEQKFISKLAYAHHQGEAFVWLGAFRVNNTHPNQFYWLSGSRFNYTNWAKEKHEILENEHCMAMFGKEGEWIDYWCTFWANAICEINQTQGQQFEKTQALSWTFFQDNNKDNNNNDIDNATRNGVFLPTFIVISGLIFLSAFALLLTIAAFIFVKTKKAGIPYTLRIR